MHPLMNRFHADEQRRLMEILGVKESSVPLLSRRVFLQSAGATGLVIGFGWLAPMDANAALPGHEVLPAFLRADAQRADQSNARNDYPASQSFDAPC